MRSLVLHFLRSVPGLAGYGLYRRILLSSEQISKVSSLGMIRQKNETCFGSRAFRGRIWSMRPVYTYWGSADDPSVHMLSTFGV